MIGATVSVTTKARHKNNCDSSVAASCLCEVAVVGLSWSPLAGKNTEGGNEDNEDARDMIARLSKPFVFLSKTLAFPQAKRYIIFYICLRQRFGCTCVSVCQVRHARKNSALPVATPSLRSEAKRLM